MNPDDAAKFIRDNFVDGTWLPLPEGSNEAFACLLAGYEAAKVVIGNDERRFKVLANATAYIKPGIGAFNTILCGLIEIQNWKGKSVTPDDLKALLSLDDSSSEPGGEDIK